MRQIVYLVFFASGASALIFQVAWVRVLSLDFGATVYAVSAVLTIFMAGLALGSYGFGRRIDRIANPLWVYASIELGVAVYGVLFVAAMPYTHRLSAWLQQGHLLGSTPSALPAFLFAMLLLIVPATLMGGTLPVLGRYVADSAETAGVRLAVLYGFNTLGGVAGCLAEAYVLILLVGVKGSILLAAALNAAVALMTGLLAIRRPTPAVRMQAGTAAMPPDSMPMPPDSAAAAITTKSGDATPRAISLWHAIAFGSGFATLATEVLWTRLLINFLSGNVLIFATVLAGFLSGMAVGSFLAALWLRQARSVDSAVAVALLGSAGCLVASVLAQRGLAESIAMLHAWDAPLSDQWKTFVSLGALLLLVTLPGAVFGTVFPLLLGWSGRQLPTLGRDVGGLYAMNTLGAILGAFASGFVMIPSLGVNGSLLILASAYALLSLMALWPKTAAVAPCAAACACIALAAAPALRRPVFWLNGGFNFVQRVPRDNTLFLEEGIEATVGVAQFNDVTTLTVNGLIVAESSRKDLWDLLLKAHLPMLLHEQPRKVALVGLGAGVSLGAVEAYDVDVIDCIEISSAVERAHRYFGAVNDRCWEDPRLNLVVSDGRHYLLTTDRRYDVISVDPLDPPVCNLYSQDFFQLCHDRLMPGGLMVQWLPLFRLSPHHLRIVMRAFLDVFDESTLWYDGTSVLLIGSRDRPLQIDYARFSRRIEQRRVQESLSTIGNPAPWILLSTYVTGPKGLDVLVGRDVPANTDNFPYLEYMILRAGQLDEGTMARNLRLLVPRFGAVEDRVREVDQTPDVLSRLRQGRRLMKELLAIRIHQLQGEVDEAAEKYESIVKEHGLTARGRLVISPFHEQDGLFDR